MPPAVASLFASFDLSGWASAAAIAGTAATVVSLVLVFLQVRAGSRTARARTTIMFQERFKESQPNRTRLFAGFPLHTSLLETIEEVDPEQAPEAGQVGTWSTRAELSEEQKEDAEKVIGALNDVAQYVVDGLELRSALQQYHIIFLRLGALLNPYLEEKNAPTGNGRQLRYGRRVPILYNAALAYHRCNSKHSGRRVSLTRAAADGSGEISPVIFDGNRGGVQQFECFADSPRESLLLPSVSLERTIRAAEAKLRQ